MCGLAICSVWIVLAPPALAFEPMPPIMQKLLEVFPEENGRFVDEPFGSIESMPKEARPLFETFRVVVPTPDDIDKNLARLFSASSHFPIKKITRYDKEPGAPGLPGFRGAWCQTEDESQVGFSIVTINQNRFLIWAKMGYYPAFATDSISPKVRDQYARDVSQYLAGIDMKVPENVAPEAGGRGLPEWMELLGPTEANCMPALPHLSEDARIAEIQCWGVHGASALTPTQALVDEIIDDAPPTLHRYADSAWIQNDFESNLKFNVPVMNLTKEDFFRLAHGDQCRFAIDRYGRIRVFGCGFPGEGEEGPSGELMFPGIPVLATGTFIIRNVPEWGQHNPPSLAAVATGLSSYYWSFRAFCATTEDNIANVKALTDTHLKALGHFLRVMRSYSVPLDNVLISKFARYY